MTTLRLIPATHVDAAWKDGARMLARACDASGGEITGDQLKLLLSRGSASSCASTLMMARAGA